MLASQDSGVRLMDLVCQEQGIIEKAGRLLEQTTAPPTSSQEVSRAAAHVCVCGGGVGFYHKGTQKSYLYRDPGNSHYSIHSFICLFLKK